MRVIGIDPGYDRVGVAIIEKEAKQKEVLLYSDCFKTSSKDDFYARLLQVGNEIERVIKEYSPEIMAIESLFIEKNQKTAMRVAEARGVITYEAAKQDIKIFEYTPLQIKLAVTGHGGSTKSQIIKMIPMLVKLSQGNKQQKAQDDEYDAIAVALTCCAYEQKSFPQAK